MKYDSASLQRSMDAAPEPWLDQQVAERVLAEVRAQCATRSVAPGVQRAACDRAGQRALRGWFEKLLSRLVPPRERPLLWPRRDQQG